MLPCSPPSMAMNCLMRSLYLPWRSRNLTPRRSPSPSSPTLPTNRHVARRLKFRRLHRAHDGQHQGQPAGVVANPRRREPRAVALDLDVGALGEHRVQMRDNRHHGARAAALAHAHRVAFGVHLDVREALLAQHLEVRLRARLLLERWRGNLVESDELLDEAVVVGLDEAARLCELRARADTLHDVIGCLRVASGTGRDSAQHEQTCPHPLDARAHRARPHASSGLPH